MMKWLLLLAFAAMAAPTFAQERILAYDTDVQVQADGSLDVAERITIHAEGGQVRRGIYREFPTRYRDRYGNRVVVGFEMRDVLRDGRPEPWFVERHGNGIRINTGNDDFLPVPASYTYTLRYRTTRQLGFFESHDELYWNAIGTGWAFPIERGSVVVRLPAPVPVSQLAAEGYTGPQGGTGQDYVATLPAPGTARWELTAPLPPGHGFTTVLSFPKGVVTAPTRSQRATWLLRDNLGLLVALLAMAVLAAWCVREWRRVGRDPAPGVIIARYEPPAGHSPGGLRYVRGMGPDQRGFSADLLALAVAGHLRIHREDGVLTDTWSLERVSGADGALDPVQRAVLATLFAEGAVLELDNKQATKLQKARALQSKAFAGRYEPAMFKRNGRSIAIAAGIGIVGGVAAFALSAGGALPLVIAACGLMFVGIVLFAVLVKAPTPEGRRLMDEIEGLKLYLGVAERVELARLRGPGEPPLLDAARYEALLPYAVALEVEEAWTAQFTDAVGIEAAAEAGRHIHWYHGGNVANLATLANDVGSSLNARIASASTPPGSSSGAGGGGFSGGGGGGGGGGGR